MTSLVNPWVSRWVNSTYLQNHFVVVTEVSLGKEGALVFCSQPSLTLSSPGMVFPFPAPLPTLHLPPMGLQLP